MINKLKPKSEFSRNVLTLMTGTTIAQAIPIAISPILTRLYTPEDFGVFALFLAITSIFGSIANARYELAIMLPKKDEDAINIVALGIIITTIFSFLIFLVILIFHTEIVELLNNKEISFWLYFIPFVVFFTGLYNVLVYWNNRKKYYKALAKATVIKSMAGAITQLSIGFIKTGPLGLISGQIASNIFANGKLFKNLIKEKNLLKNIKKIKIIAMFRKYINFFRYSSIATLFNGFYHMGMPILINIFYSSSIVGWYFFANKMVRLPLSLIFSSFSQVYYQKASSLYNEKKIEELYQFTLKIQFKIGVILLFWLVILSSIGPFIFGLIFGENWIEAGEYIKYFAIFIFFNMLYSPISSIGDILNKQKLLLFFNISITLSQIIAIFLLSDILSFKYTLLVISILGSIHFIFLNFYMMNILKGKK